MDEDKKVNPADNDDNDDRTTDQKRLDGLVKAREVRARNRQSKSAAENLPKQKPKPVTPRPAAMKRRDYSVRLPSGGKLSLQDAEEVELWEESAKRYIDDYGLARANDLMLLGAILSQALAMFRAQRNLADEEKASASQGIIIKAAEEIRALEKALGIDKKTREAGGQHTVADYVTRLKRAAHVKGVHITERTKRYESFMMEMRWRIRLLRNGDQEDKAYHNLSDAGIVQWAENELAQLEEADKAWSREKSALFVGRL